mmetsp:Transcript_5638/g.6600  ORF Transcript_5638/g.6600 Transcript_5638/m.6600 type:complete len:225 (+) Transcript_5638:47-721(+)
MSVHENPVCFHFSGEAMGQGMLQQTRDLQRRKITLKLETDHLQISSSSAPSLGPSLGLLAQLSHRTSRFCLKHLFFGLLGLLCAFLFLSRCVHTKAYARTTNLFFNFLLLGLLSLLFFSLGSAIQILFVFRKLLCKLISNEICLPLRHKVVAQPIDSQASRADKASVSNDQRDNVGDDCSWAALVSNIRLTDLLRNHLTANQQDREDAVACSLVPANKWNEFLL